MEIKEVLDEVKGVAKNVENFTAKAESAEKEAKAAKEAAAKATEEFQKSIKVVADAQAEMAKAAEENQKALNTLITEAKTARENGVKIDSGVSFEKEFGKVIKENHDALKQVSQGQKFKTKMSGNASMFKAAANMTTATDLSGSPVINFLPQPALLPAQKVNVRDLVSSFQSSEITINLFRESNPSPAQGGFAQQLTEGTLKSAIEYNYSNVSFTATYIAGIVRFAKQMMYNLPWLQSALPRQLIRDFYIKENATFIASLVAAATGSTSTTDGGVAGRLIQVIANIEGTNFTTNGIVVTPAVWAALMLTTVPTVGTAYSIPGGVQIMPGGQMTIAGIPILKANWVGTNRAIVGDWTMASIAQVENLKIEFFEQDSDNVERNLITARVEALEVLVIERPEAFANKDTTSNS
jgi:HK97 family phage major capsid protein